LRNYLEYCVQKLTIDICGKGPTKFSPIPKTAEKGPRETFRFCPNILIGQGME
jgi:hypothetical protein